MGCGQVPITTSRWSSQSSLTTLASTEAANDTTEVAASDLPPQTITAVNHRDGALKDETPNPPEDGSCWGRLEAIKLTGDPNVPREEYSWIAEDIGPRGLLRIANEQMFEGARVLRSVGHSLAREFQNGSCLSGTTKTTRQDVLTCYNRSIRIVATDYDLL